MMGILNGKLIEIAAALAGIAAGEGSARLKYAANLNRTYIEGPLKALEEARTELIEGEVEWSKVREETILADCLRNEDGTPVVNAGGSYQFKSNVEFQAKIDDLQRKKFPELLDPLKKREENYRSLLVEEVEIANFPYLIKWSFVDIDEDGRMVGLTGEQQYTLLSASMFDGEPPWLDEGSTSSGAAKKNKVGKGGE